MFIVLLSNIVNASNHAKFVSLIKQKFKTDPILLNLHPNEYSQEFHYYPFAVKLESKTLTKHISCECKCKFDGTKCDSNQWWNNGKCRCDCQKHHICEKDYVRNPTTYNCENGKCLSSIMDNSAIICDKIINIKETNLNEKNITCKTQSSCVFLAFLLITIAFLSAVSIYCYLIKYQRKHLLPFHNTDNKLIKFYIDSIN